MISVVRHRPPKIWIVRELERVIVEKDVPARMRPYVDGGARGIGHFAPNVFSALGEAMRYAAKLTTEYMETLLDQISGERRNPIVPEDAVFWEALAKLELLSERGWPIVME